MRLNRLASPGISSDSRRRHEQAGHPSRNHPGQENPRRRIRRLEIKMDERYLVTPIKSLARNKKVLYNNKEEGKNVISALNL
jgi:hypothetical protein